MQLINNSFYIYFVLHTKQQRKLTILYGKKEEEKTEPDSLLKTIARLICFPKNKVISAINIYLYLFIFNPYIQFNENNSNMFLLNMGAK